ncbi:MAG: sigma-70 family RNA polymerase sigma factor [Planctomycetota bacterium]
MAEHDTSIPGPADFPPTAWSRLIDRPDAESADFLATHYWKPAYLYVRRKWRRSNEDAKDLTQSFFAEALRSDFLAKADPARGSFRRFLKASLENFLRKQHRDAKAEKRGGGKPALSLDDVGEAEELASREGDPDSLFDREWLESMFERCLPRLRDEFAKEGKDAYYEVFRRYEIERPTQGGTTYDELAKEFKISTSDVRNWLHNARTRWRKIVLDEMRETCESAADLEAEARALFPG